MSGVLKLGQQGIVARGHYGRNDPPTAIDLLQNKGPITGHALRLSFHHEWKREGHDQPRMIIGRRGIARLMTLEAPSGDLKLVQYRLQAFGIGLSRVLARPGERWKIVDNCGSLDKDS